MYIENSDWLTFPFYDKIIIITLEITKNAFNKIEPWSRLVNNVKFKVFCKRFYFLKVEQFCWGIWHEKICRKEIFFN